MGITKLKRQDITQHRVNLIKLLKEDEMNNQQIADIFQITRENVRKLLLAKRSIHYKKIN